MLLMTLRRDLGLAFRDPADIANPVFFFVLVVSLFPLGIDPREETLALLAPGVVWIAALLATLLSLENLFKSDYDDGSLDQMGIAQQPFLLIVTGKILAHWCTAGLPLVLLSPVLGVMLGLDMEGIKAMMLSLALGTPILSLLGAVGASLTVSVKKGGVLVSLLILPLYVPVLILGTTLIQTAIQGGNTSGHTLWLLALAALSAGLGPVATAAGLKIALSR